jgi:hypothetical protein
MSYFLFELGDQGQLIGSVGDAPETFIRQLESIELVGSEFSSRPPSQAPEVRWLTGQIFGDTAFGTFFQGIEASMTMRKAAPGP